MNEELKPCPFCGTDGTIELDIEKRLKRVYCDNQIDCPMAPSAYFDTLDECRAAWNRRTPAVLPEVKK